MQPQEFDALYASGGWDGQGSGPGSTEEFTRDFRERLVSLLTERKIKSVFDLGCGDWQWQRHVPWSRMGVQYTGWDISSNAINSVFKLFNGSVDLPQPRFEIRDAFECPIWPEAELLIVKDVVHHISKYRVRQLVERAKLYDWVLWVVDTDGKESIINYGGLGFFEHGTTFTKIFEFDTSPPYQYGPKAAFLQENP